MIRIVRLTFKPEHSDDFIAFISDYRDRISHFSGCRGVDFLRDIAAPNVFMTYSYWDSELALNQYRDSELFQIVWSTVKQWFADKPSAWSLEKF